MIRNTIKLKSANWRERIIYESIEIQLCSKAMNKEDMVTLK